MNSRFFCALAPLVAIPSIAMAAEPAKGTVITIASISAWVVFSSVGIIWRRKRQSDVVPSDGENAPKA